MLTQPEEETIAGFFQHEYLLVHDVTRWVAERARQLSRRHGLRSNDAIHLATGLMAGADIFETWNTNDFLHLVGQVPIRIRVPTWEGPIPMRLE